MLSHVFWGKNSPKTVYNLKNFETSTRSEIMETDTERDLGVQLSKDLKWNNQAKKSACRARYAKKNMNMYVLELRHPKNLIHNFR